MAKSQFFPCNILQPFNFRFVSPLEACTDRRLLLTGEVPERRRENRTAVTRTKCVIRTASPSIYHRERSVSGGM